jgi:TonB family protein
MRALETWLFNYLLNSLWQVPLLFAAAWLAARSSRRAGPAFQHGLWTSALVAEVLLPACTARPDRTFLALLHWLASFHQSPIAPTAQVTVTVGPAQAAEGLQLAPALLTAAALLYLCAFVYFIARLSIGLHRTTSLHRRAEPLALTGHAGQSYHRFAQLFGVRNAIVAASAEIASPITLGIRRPILLLPSELEANILSEDLDAALAHEFAHMRRRDFAKNLAYEVLSLPIAFHPILRLTRRHMAESRELICDALAADAVAGRQRYARSLLRLATTFSQHAQPTTPHAIGIFDANPFQNFERRVMNLTDNSMELRGAARFATAALSLFLIGGACTSALAFRLQVAAPSPQPAPIPQATPAPEPTPAPQPTPAPSQFRLAVPRATGSEPAKTIKIEVQPLIAANVSPQPMLIKVLTPAVIGGDQTTSDGAAHVSSNVIAGNLLTRANPVYPPEAKAAKLNGTVVLNAIIGKDGKIQNLQVSTSTNPIFNDSALDAVRQWIYKPYLLNGNPTEVETKITVNYSLEGANSATPTPSPSPQAANPSPSTARNNPIVIHTGDVKVPAGARKDKVHGTVLVSLVVGKDGLPRDVEVKKSLRPDFDQSALEAVRDYRFEPALRDGTPVEAKLFLEIDFQTLK